MVIFEANINKKDSPLQESPFLLAEFIAVFGVDGFVVILQQQAHLP